MLGPEVRTLMHKEWRQLVRSRGAMASALLLPLLLLLVLPVGQMLGMRAAGSEAVRPLPPGVNLPPGLVEMNRDPAALLRALVPLLIALGGIIVPAVTATYTLIAERESRTLELLAALPVRIGQILWAKLLVILALAGSVTGTFVVIDAVLVVALGIGSLGFAVSLLVLLFAALAYSSATALLTSLLARDFRTANNINGALIGPTIVVLLCVLLFMPGTAMVRVLTLAGFFVVATSAALYAALRVVTFERLLR
jgi:ABC-type transport system involved in multi-copper enzyme maturation permease subunit